MADNPTKLDGFSDEQTSTILLLLEQQRQELLRELETDADAVVHVERTVRARKGQFLRLHPPPAGQSLILPHPATVPAGDAITVSLEAPEGSLRVVSAPRMLGTTVQLATVNGAEVATYTAAGLLTFTGNGKDRWQAASQFAAEAAISRAVVAASGALDATYHLQTADTRLPNARAAASSTEIDPDYASVGVVSWVLRTASVAFGKLANLTGLSVLGRASSSAGVMAAITAGANNQVLRRTSDALNFGAVSNAMLDTDVTWAATLARGNLSDIYSPNIQNYAPFNAYLSFGDEASIPLSGDIRATGTFTINVDGGAFVATPTAGVTLTGGTASSLTATTGVLNLTSTASSLNCVAGSQVTLTAAVNIIGEATAGDVRVSAPSGGVSFSAGHAAQNPAAGDYLCNATSGWCLHAGATPATAATGGELSSDTTITVRTNGVTRAVFNAAGDVDWPNGFDFDVTGSATFDATVDYDITTGGDYSVTASGFAFMYGVTGSDVQSAGPVRLFSGVGGSGDITLRAGNGNVTLSTTVAGFCVEIISTVGSGQAYLQMDEESSSALSVPAGRGMWWVKNDAPTVPMFTDDTNVDNQLAFLASVFKTLNVQSITASGNYTPTSGMKWCLVILTGSGAGGGGADSSTTTNNLGVGGGGGAGATRWGFFSAATIGASQAVTLPAGGAGGTAAGGTGSAPASATFGALLTAPSGSGGQGKGTSTVAAMVSNGGAGGTVGSGGLFGAPGGDGSPGYGHIIDGTVGDGTYAMGGTGGASFWGGGGRGGTIDSATIGASVTSSGASGPAPGSGGGGAVCSDTTAGAAGSAGTIGICVVIEFV